MNQGGVMGLTEEDILRAFADMINTLEIKHFLPLLDNDFHYASQSVLAEISSKAEFAEYMTAKLETLKRAGGETIAELGRWTPYRDRPCVLLSQGGNPTCTAIMDIRDGKVARIDLCIVPSPGTVVL
jgi:hypothetical protein